MGAACGRNLTPGACVQSRARGRDTLQGRTAANLGGGTHPIPRFERRCQPAGISAHGDARGHRCGLRHGRPACSQTAIGRPQTLAGRGILAGTAPRRHALHPSMRGAAASARSLSAHAVARVLREGGPLDAALKDALVAADPKLFSSVRSLSYGAVRGYFRHEAILARLLSGPVRSLDFLVRALLSVALYELEDERTPEYAVVDAAVQTAKATAASRASR